MATSDLSCIVKAALGDQGSYDFTPLSRKPECIPLLVQRAQAENAVLQSASEAAAAWIADPEGMRRSQGLLIATRTVAIYYPSDNKSMIAFDDLAGHDGVTTGHAFEGYVHHKVCGKVLWDPSIDFLAAARKSALEASPQLVMKHKMSLSSPESIMQSSTAWPDYLPLTFGRLAQPLVATLKMLGKKTVSFIPLKHAALHDKGLCEVRPVMLRINSPYSFTAADLEIRADLPYTTKAYGRGILSYTSPRGVRSDTSNAQHANAGNSMPSLAEEHPTPRITIEPKA